MTDHHALIRDQFLAFSTQAPNHAKAWMALVQSLIEVSSLDPKRETLRSSTCWRRSDVKKGFRFTSLRQQNTELQEKTCSPQFPLNYLQQAMSLLKLCTLPREL